MLSSNLMARVPSFRQWCLLAIPLCCLACSKPKTTPITNREHGWVYDLPEGFVKRSIKLPPFVQQFVGPREDGEQVNIVIESLPGSDSAEAVGKAVAKNPGRDIVVQEYGPYNLTEMKAYTVKVTRNKGTEGQRQIYITQNGICVIFTVTAPIKSFDEWDQVLKDSLQNFHWTKRVAPKQKAI